MKNFADQDELLADRQRLELRARSLRAEIYAKTGETVAVPTYDRTDCFAGVATMEAHVLDLESRLAGKAETVQPKLTKPKTLTEKILAARGVNSIEALREQDKNKAQHIAGD